MNKSVDEEFVVEHLSTKRGSEDLKLEWQAPFTNMDFVRQHRDFSMISERDLEAVFRQLRTRCPET